MSNEKIKELEKEIGSVKDQLMGIGAMRPGTLTKQYKDRGNQAGGYYQLSYTHQMKSRTEYVRAAHVQRLEEEVAAYKNWRGLIERWVDLSIKLSREKIAGLKGLS